MIQVKTEAGSESPLPIFLLEDGDKVMLTLGNAQVAFWRNRRWLILERVAHASRVLVPEPAFTCFVLFLQQQEEKNYSAVLEVTRREEYYIPELASSYPLYMMMDGITARA